MGSIVFDFLTESFLFDENRIESAFAGQSDDEINAELRRYREFCLAHLGELEQEALRSKSALRVFAGVQRVSLRTLKQSAFYVEQYVLPDPLFVLTSESTHLDEGVRSYLGFQERTLNRAELATVLRYLRALTPMVAHDFVRFLPVSYLFEPPAETPICYSENYFDDVLPSEIMDFFRERAIVRSLRKANEGWLVEDKLSVGRAIAIQFRDHDSSKVFIQHLFEQEIVDWNRDTGIATFRMYLPDASPSREYFQAWLHQSVNRAAQDFYRQLDTEFSISGRLAASYFSTSQFVFDLLAQFAPGVQAQPSGHTANTLLNIDLPFLDGVDTDTLMSVRANDGEVFQNFRNELDKQFFELRLESDPDRFQVKAQKVIHDLSEVQTHALAMKASDLRKGALAQSVLVTATLAGSMIALGLAPIAPVVAAAGVAKVVYDYRASLRSNPAFFLWKVIRPAEQPQ